MAIMKVSGKEARAPTRMNRDTTSRHCQINQAIKSAERRGSEISRETPETSQGKPPERVLRVPTQEQPAELCRGARSRRAATIPRLPPQLGE